MEQGFQERLGIQGVRDDPRMELRVISSFMVNLPKIDHEFTSIVPDFKAIRVEPSDLEASPGATFVLFHGLLNTASRHLRLTGVRTAPFIF